MTSEEELYRRIVGAVPEGIWVVNPQGGTIFCNERMAQLLGTDVESLKNMSCFDPVFPEDLEEAKRHFGLQMEGAPPFDFRLRRNDGTSIWVSISSRPMHDDSGAVTGLLGLFTDITARKRAEAILRESEQRFRIMADTAPVMIWVSGPDRLCIFFNKYWLDFTGRTMEQELGNGWAENVHPQDLDRCFQIYTSSFDARHSFQMQYRLCRADGEYRWILDNGVPRVDPSGSFEGYIGSCIDITDFKRAQEMHVAKEKLETVGAMAGGIVHDFGNLLAGIMAYADVVEVGFDSGLIARDEVREIRNAAVRGTEIARKLTIFAELAEDEVLEPVDISAIVGDVLELVRASVPENVAVESHLERQLGMVRAHPAKVRQIVMHLVTNASEAIGDRAGLIRVMTAQVRVGNESNLNLKPGDYVQIEVSDTGPGMTPELRDRVFDMFVTTKGLGIHGLGLAAVHGIVERYQGTVRLSTAEGSGTSFQVLLPCGPSGRMGKGTAGATPFPI